MDNVAHRTVTLQVSIALAGAALGYLGGAAEAGQAAFYGGIVGTVNGLSLLRKVKQAEAEKLPERALAVLLSGAVNRFIVVLVLFGVGFGVLHLSAAPALMTFAASQLAYGWGLRESYKDIL
ncbi:MAG: ATP synthase subunit I [Sulfuricellaceae bacterium]